MFFYEWVVPSLAVLAIAVWLFYSAIKNKAGAGVRTDGHTVVDKPVNDETLPPG
jgi:hypothetical protein